MSDARVRPARLDDAMLLAGLQRAWWRDAYPDLLPAEVRDIALPRLAQAWEAQQAAGTILIAEEGTVPVGFAAVAGALEDGSVGRIELLGVLPRWSRRGHGGRLLAACTAVLREAGARLGVYWAVEADETVTSFLYGAGWSRSGQRRVLDTGQAALAEAEFAGPLDLAVG